MAAAAIFCASPKKDGACLKELRATLEERGIKVLPEELIVHGKGGFLSGKNPTEEDLEAARSSPTPVWTRRSSTRSDLPGKRVL